MYFSARKKLEELKVSIRSEKLNLLIDNFLSRIWYPFFIYPFFKIYKIIGKNPIILKFDVWEESSLEISQVRHLPYLIRKIFNPKEIFFIDIDKKLVNLAKKNMKHFKFKKAAVVNGNIANMPFKDSAFELVIDFSTMDHLNLMELKKTMREIHRVLKKNGYVITYNLNSEYFNIKNWNYRYRKFFPSFARKLSTIKALLSKKFEIVDYGYTFPLFADYTLLICYRFIYNKLYRFLPRKLLFSFFNSPKLNLFFYLIARKI
jgi:SAM-dependent methyltransferase